MAAIEFVGVAFPPAEKTVLEEAARRLPQDWAVRVTANVAPPFVVEVAIEGLGIAAVFEAPAISKVVRAGEVQPIVAALDEVRRAYDDAGHRPGEKGLPSRRRRS